MSDDGIEAVDQFFDDGDESAIVASAMALATATAADGTTTTTTHVSYRRHMIEASKLTYPIILSEIGQNTLPVIDIAFVGQLGKDELGAAALAYVIGMQFARIYSYYNA